MSKISELSDGGSLVSTDFLIAVRSGGNVKVKMDTINVDQVTLGDNEFIRLGNSQDLTLVHTSTQSIINQAGVGDLLLQKAGTTKASITANGLEFPDNSKAIFGAGSDLQLFSNGTSSYIIEGGSGNLEIRATDIFLKSADNTKALATFDADGAVSISHNGSTKLATSASGISVTGTVTADGLVVDGASSGSTVATFTSNALVNTPLLVFQRSGGAVAGKIAYDDTNTAITFGTTTNHEVIFLTNNTQKMQLDSSGNLLIGKTSSANAQTTVGHLLLPDGRHYATASGGPSGIFSRTTSDGDILSFYQGSTPTLVGSIGTSGGVPYFAGPNSSAGGFRLDSTGTNGVIIPTTNTGANRDAATDLGYSSGGTNIRFRDLHLTGTANVGALKTNGSVESAGNLSFWVPNVGEAVRIEQNTGNVGIGVSASLQGKLNVGGSTTGDPSMYLFGSRGAANDLPAGHFTFRNVANGVGDIDLSRIQSTTGTGTNQSQKGKLNFQTNGSGGLVTRLTIDEDGGMVIKSVGGNTTAGFYGGNLVNGITGVPSAAGTPFVLGRDTGTLRSAHFAGHLKFDSGYGVSFAVAGGTGTSNSSVLDDYEEGTFTPSLLASAVNPSSTYGTRIGKYTKVGNKVTVYIFVSTSAFSGGSGDLWVAGLPFAASQDCVGGAPMFYRVNSFTETAPFVNSGASYVVFIGRDNTDTSTAWSVMQTSAWTASNPTITQFSITYFTNS